MKSSLVKALPIVAQAFGEQFGIRVRIGTRACTDGEEITIPALENPGPELWGYVDHEAAHHAHTDFSVWGDTPVEQGLCNVIEDVRIERLLVKDWPGTRPQLLAIWEVLHEKGELVVPTPDAHPASVLNAYVLYRIRAEQTGLALFAEYLSRTEQIAEAVLPPGFLTRADVLLDAEMDRLCSTKDAKRLAKAILKALEEAEQDAKDAENGDDDRSDINQPEGADSDGIGESTSSDDPDASDDGANSPSDTSSDVADESRSTPSDDQRNDGHQSNVPVDSSSSDKGGPNSENPTIAQQMADATESDLLQDVMDMLADHLNQDDVDREMAVASLTVSNGVIHSGGDTEALTAGLLASGQLRARLTSLLQARARTSVQYRSRGRQIEGRRLTRTLSGDSQVFRHQTEAQRLDTAVHLLIDRSYSMKHVSFTKSGTANRQEMANQAAVALGVALNTITGVDYAVSAFPGDIGDVAPLLRRGMSVQANLSKLALTSAGGTPLAPAMLAAAKELANSPRSRRVMIIVTDGEPDNSSGVQYVRKMIEHEIDIYAIGIELTAVRSLFPESVVISDVSELPGALLDLANDFLKPAA